MNGKLYGEKVIAIIPARAGSKRMPHKNVLQLNGISLLERAIQAAQAARYVDRVIVTTDDPKAMYLAGKCGAELKIRPDHLATDDADLVDVLQHALHGEDHTIEVQLYPTSPFRYPGLVDECIILARHYGRGVTVRQAGGKHLGACVATKYSVRRNTTKKEALVPLEYPYDIDVDTPEDWCRAESAARETEARRHGS